MKPAGGSLITLLNSANVYQAADLLTITSHYVPASLGDDIAAAAIAANEPGPRDCVLTVSSGIGNEAGGFGRDLT